MATRYKIATQNRAETLTNKNLSSATNTFPAATTTSTGVVEKSTSAENIAGTSDTVYPTVAGTKEMIDTHAGGGGASEFARAYSTGGQTVTATEAIVVFDTESYDDGSNFSTSTYKYTCPSAGKYAVNVAVEMSNLSDQKYLWLVLKKNSTAVVDRWFTTSSTNRQTVWLSTVVSCATSDTLAAYISSDDGSASLETGASHSYFEIYKLA